MLEGRLYYDDSQDYWYLIDMNGEKLDISEIIYSLVESKKFDDKSWHGEGEHFKLTFEVDGKVMNRY